MVKPVYQIQNKKRETLSICTNRTKVYEKLTTILDVMKFNKRIPSYFTVARHLNQEGEIKVGDLWVRKFNLNSDQVTEKRTSDLQDLRKYIDEVNKVFKNLKGKQRYASRLKGFKSG
jgi:hypothetical protein